MRTTALALTVLFLAGPAAAQDSTPQPESPKQTTDQAFEAFLAARKKVLSLRRGPKDQRAVARDALRKVADGFLTDHATSANKKQLSLVFMTWRSSTVRKDPGAVKARIAKLKANDQVDASFRTALAGHEAYQPIARLRHQIFALRRQRKKKQEVDALRDRIYPLTKPWLEKYATAGFGQQVTVVLREYMFQARRMKDGEALEALMTDLNSKIDQLPHRAQFTVRSYFIRAGIQAPDWKAKDLADGSEVTLSGLRGKLVLVDFWASWCRPCLGLMKKRLAPLHAKYESDERFVLISLGSPTRDTAQKQRDTAKKLGVTWRKAFDASGGAMKSYFVHGIPYLCLVDEQGKILACGSGWKTIGQIENILTERLGAGTPKKMKSGDF